MSVYIDTSTNKYIHRRTCICIRIRIDACTYVYAPGTCTFFVGAQQRAGIEKCVISGRRAAVARLNTSGWFAARGPVSGDSRDVSDLSGHLMPRAHADNLSPIAVGS